MKGGANRENLAPFSAGYAIDRVERCSRGHAHFVQYDRGSRNTQFDHEICHHTRFRDSTVRSARAYHQRGQPFFVQLGATRRTQSQCRAGFPTPYGRAEHDDGVSGFNTLGSGREPYEQNSHNAGEGEREQ